MVKFIHTADWHLGMRRHFLNDEAVHRYRQDRIDAVRRVGEIAERQGCSFIVAAGDLLDSNQVDRTTLVRTAEALRSISMPVYLLPGNHDPADASSLLCGSAFAALCPPNVRVLQKPGTIEDPSGVQIVAAPWDTRRPLTDLVRDALEGLEAGPVRVVVGHGAVEEFGRDGTDPALIGLAEIEAALAAGTIHYVALGDRHSTTNVGHSRRVWYSGTPEPTAFDEKDPGNVLVVSLDRDRIEVEPHRVGRWNLRRVSFEFAGDEDLGRFHDTLQDIQDREWTAIRLALRGTLTLDRNARLENLLEDLRHVFAGITMSIGRSELAVVPEDADFEDLQLVGFAQSAVNDLRGAADAGGDGAGVAKDALGLLLRLAGRDS
jgi:DNA repair exonuclease SbcCD nuclease subunit